MIRTGFTIAAALALAALTQAPAVAAQETTSPPQAADTTTLEISFTNIAPATGQIMLALFDSEDAYNSGGMPVRAIALQVTDTTATATIENLLHGRYGFKIVHDVNGDGAMNTNPFGMPIEPFAFSNNAVGNMGPAMWQAAAFDIAGPTTQTINFR